MMSSALIESLDPITIGRYAEDAFKTMNDFIGEGGSFADNRGVAYRSISGNPVVITVLNDVLKKVAASSNPPGFEKYVSGLRYTKKDDQLRTNLYLVSTVIPAVAKYLLDKADTVNGADSGDVRKAKQCLEHNYLNARQPSTNPMEVASNRFGEALVSAAELGTPSRKNTPVEDDTSASQLFHDKLGGIKFRLDSANDFVNAVVMSTVGLDNVRQEEIDSATRLLLARYITIDKAVKLSGIPDYGKFLDNTLSRSKSSLSKTKDVARIDDAVDADDNTDAIQNDSRLVPKSIGDAADDTNQHSVIGENTRFLANTYTKLFTANFAELLAKQPAGSSSKKVGNRQAATRNDVMTAIRLIFKHVLPKMNAAALTPETVESITTNTLADDTKTALYVHKGMAEYTATSSPLRRRHTVGQPMYRFVSTHIGLVQSISARACTFGATGQPSPGSAAASPADDNTATTLNIFLMARIIQNPAAPQRTRNKIKKYCKSKRQYRNPNSHSGILLPKPTSSSSLTTYERAKSLI